MARSLLHIGEAGSLFPDASAIPVICPLTTGGTAEDPARLECLWQQAVSPHYVRYHAKQFVSAVLVLVRYMMQFPGMGHVDVHPSLKALHFDLETVSLQYYRHCGVLHPRRMVLDGHGLANFGVCHSCGSTEPSMGQHSFLSVTGVIALQP